TSLSSRTKRSEPSRYCPRFFSVSNFVNSTTASYREMDFKIPRYENSGQSEYFSRFFLIAVRKRPWQHGRRGQPHGLSRSASSSRNQSLAAFWTLARSMADRALP